MEKSPSREEREWREALRDELQRRKIPRAWQARLMEELDDHLSDLKEERMSTTEFDKSVVERLGHPEQIAEAAAAEYRKLGFFARHPVLTYFVLPIVTMPLALVLFVELIMLPTSWALGSFEAGVVDETRVTLVANSLVATAANLVRFVPFAAVAWFFACLARWHGRGWRCVLSACGIVAIYAATFSVTIKAKTATEQGKIMMALTFPPQQAVGYLQAAVPLALGLLVAWRNQSRRPPQQNAPSPSPSAFQVAAG